MSDRTALPRNWVLTTLGDVFVWSSGGTPKSTERSYYGGDIPWVVIGDLTDGLVTRTTTCITPEGIANSSAKWVERGSVLVAMYGSIGKLGIAGVRLTTNQAIAFTNPEPFDSKYLFWYLASIRSNLVRLGQGGTQQNISQTLLRQVPFPLAPNLEQRRIVAALEEHLSDLDAAVAGLERARANVERYREAVRDAAVTGSLCSLHPSNKPSREHDDLPRGWSWLSVGECASPEPHAITDGPFGSKLKTAHYMDSGPRVIRLQNIGRGQFVDAMAHISPDHFDTLGKHRVFAGDVVIAALGETLPRACIIPEHVGPAIVKADCIRFKPDGSKLLAAYANIALNAEYTRKRVTSMVHGVGRPRLNLSEVKAVRIPVPSLSEQAAIVTEVECRLAVADRTAAEIDVQIARAKRLRQAILKRAFEGKLVPQDPNDEPASVLLERIGAGRADAPATRRAGRRAAARR